MSESDPRAEGAQPAPWTPPAATTGAPVPVAPPALPVSPPPSAYASPAPPPLAAPASAAPPQHPAPQAPLAPPVPPAPDRAPRRFGSAAIVVALAAGAVLGGASGAGVAVVALSGAAPGAPGGIASPQTITINDTDDVDVVTAVAAKAMPSVVTISVASSTGGGTGSGVVIDDRGHIVTNTHVVTLDGAVADPTITVRTSDGRMLPATIVGTDPIMDLAVIQVDPAAGLLPIELADSDALNVGDDTVAIGAPLGLAGTVTSGIVSALNRSITVASSAVPETPAPEQEHGGGSGSDDFFNFDIPGQSSAGSASGSIYLVVIQTDTAINPGNSGGALLDDTGRLIGVNVAIASSGSGASAGDIGIGFAIPSNVVARVADELIGTGSASHGLLGATVANVSDDPAQQGAGVLGASIVELTAGGAAEQAGLRVGDIVVEFAGAPVTGRTDLTAQVRTHAAGATATLTYLRGGESRTVEVTLGAL